MNKLVPAIYLSVSILLFTLLGIAQGFPHVHFSYSHSVVPWFPWLALGLGIFSLLNNESHEK
ncbi:hypothetical protein Q7A53_10205 [Halobacillus rhizosphaerae]|uniref:hypothetical protein n=1 Tax=Halobacillus rhizosphaerae TaxID=3064889 RepID=UPI00398A8EE3